MNRSERRRRIAGNGGFTSCSNKKETKVYVLCGFVSTFLLLTVLLAIDGAFGVLLNVPLSRLNSVLFESTMGPGGVKLLNKYSMFLGVMLSFLLMMFIVKPWRPYLKALGTAPSGNRFRMLVLGLLIGFAMNGASVLAAASSGSVHLEFKRFSVIGLLVFLIFVLVQSSTEEMLCRGFAYQRLKRTYGTAVAVLGSSAIFSIAHMFNSGVTVLALVDIFLTGVLYALMVRYFDGIWLTMGVHTAWNYTQNIIFGLPNSGEASTYSFFGLVGDCTNGFAYDTAFGVEGTIFAVVLNALCIAGVLLWGRLRGKRDYDIWGGESGVAQVKRRWFY